MEPSQSRKVYPHRGKLGGRVIVMTTGDGLTLIETHPNIYKRRVVFYAHLVAAGIIDSGWNKPFYIRIEKFRAE